MSDELQEIINSSPEWYRDLQYKDVKVFIQDNINSTCRSFVAIGYYLKYIRDNQMFTNDGYENIWEMARAEYGISKSQASKFMSINDKFSKGGNSPILVDKYKDFSSSKLSEMLYLTDEQLEQVTVGTTVAQLREIRKPEEVVSEHPESNHEFKTCKFGGGKCNLWLDPDTCSGTKRCNSNFISDQITEEVVSTSKQEPKTKKPYYRCAAYLQYQYTKGCKDCIYDKADCPYDRTGYFAEIKRKEEWSKHCEVLKEMCNCICKMMSHVLEKNNYSMDTIKSLSRKDQEFSFGFGDDNGYSKYMARCKSERYYVETFDEAEKWIFEAGEVDQHIWNFNGWEWHNNHPKSEETKALTIDELDFTVRTYNCLKHASIDTIDQLCKLTEDEVIAIRNISRKCIDEIKLKLSEIGKRLKSDDISEIVNDEPEIVDNEPEIVNDVDEALPCDTCGHDINGCCDYDDESNWCELGSAWIPKEEYLDQFETVEADIIPTVPEEPFADQCEAPGLKFNNWLKANGSSIADIVSIVLYDKKIPDKDNLLTQIENSLISRLISKTEAYYSYLTRELGIEPEQPRQIQPELPILKNNDQRKEWAENYKVWGEWYYDEHIDCHYYKYDFPTGDRLIVEEYRDRERIWSEDNKDEQYYHLLLKIKQSYNKKRTYEEKFSHQTSSMTEITDYLKDLQKK